MRTRHDPEEAAFDERYRDAARLIAEGRLGRATLLTRETSDRRYRGAQLVIGVFEIEDPADGDGRAPDDRVRAHLRPGAGAALAARARRSTSGSTRSTPTTSTSGADAGRRNAPRSDDRRRIVGASRSVLARDATVTVAAGHEDRGDERDRGDREDRDDFEHGSITDLSTM